jgi:hypothetical protein
VRRLAVVALLALPSDPRVVARDAAPAPSVIEEVVAALDAELVAEAPDTRPPSRKKVHLKKGELTLTVARTAARYLSRPMGSEVVKVVEGRRYAFCVEEHYHAPGSGLTPEGWHKGVTVYGFED